MNISKLLSDMMRYVSEAAARIFSPSDDAYPNIGVQPFEGEPYKQHQWGLICQLQARWLTILPPNRLKAKPFQGLKLNTKIPPHQLG